ncbi:MAG: hypothetical protein AAFW75_27200 [Cyanobacteria bacterium J06636_16]
MPTVAELEAQRDNIERQIEEAKKAEKASALKKVEAALSELNALGYAYTLTEGEAGTSTRRTGVRDDVLKTIQSGSGMKPADVAEALGMSDKRGKQSVSNAISALKKAGKIAVTDGNYTAV